MSRPCNREELERLVASIQQETDSTNLVRLVQQLIDAFDSGVNLTRPDDLDAKDDHRHCA